MSFNPQNESTAQAALEVQTLVLPFEITGSATAASVVFKSHYPALLFAKTQGVDQCTEAAGALDSDDTVPTFASASDSGGDFGIIVRVGEEIEKVVSCMVEIASAENAGANGIYCSAPSTGIVAGGALDKIAMDVKNAPAFNTSVTVKGCIVVRYIVA
jgi:hypothetical protein